MCPISPKVHRRHLHTCHHVRGHENHLCNVEVQAANLSAQPTTCDQMVRIWVHTSQPNFLLFVPLLQFEKRWSGVVFALLTDLRCTGVS
jgi:hypothetical protein